MLAWLVLVGGLHHATAGVSDIPKDTNYLIKQNASCPASGFFFHRETSARSLHSDLCYLCFCQNNGTAVCWRRENRACDLEHYQDFDSRSSRSRRSPLSFGEVFVRDAARDFFNKQSPEQCKPFESSFSDGCPPVDWCIGCTVCDCDANGRWDCHILSFCNDKNGKKKMKKRRGRSGNRISKRQSKTTNPLQSTKVTTKSPIKQTTKRSGNANLRRNHVKQSTAKNKQKINQVKATKVNKFASVKKPPPKLQAKKAIPNRKKVTSRSMYIKKNVSTNKPLNIKTSNDKTIKNNTVEVAQKVVKQFMSTVQRMIKNFDLKTNATNKVIRTSKVIKKRSMSKQNYKTVTKKAEQKPKLGRKQLPDSNKNRFGKTNSASGRTKRQVAGMRNTSLNYSSTWNTNQNIYKGVKFEKNPTQLETNYTSSILNASYNERENISLQQNITGRDFYVTDDQFYPDTEHNTENDSILFERVNYTDSIVLWTVGNNNLKKNNSSKVKNITLLTTERSYLSTTHLIPLDRNKNETSMKSNQIGKYKDRELKKENFNSNVSTQTENQSKEYGCKFRTLLQKLIGIDKDQHNNNSTTKQNFKSSRKPKRYTIFTKIKRLLKKIFNKKNRSKVYHKDELYYSDFSIKQSDYKVSGNCKFDSEEKDKLRGRMNQLKNESRSILKTIGIIKGLLHILKLDINQTMYNASSSFNETNENINKLNIILKNTYGENDDKLTANQRTQLTYIKDNVQVFIRSIGKFARILDDVIKIALCHFKKENQINNATSSKNNRGTNMTKDHKNSTQIKIEKLKKLILNYNVLQNKFIHQIYTILNNLEANITEKYSFKPEANSEYYFGVNKTDLIETNSANIINNIKKLKLLADRLNVQKRQKRESIDDDDSLEYLLILMEYLLKRHSPAYPQVKDGIDLLIEAIKSAPDIKLSRKKVLDDATEKSIVTRTATPQKLLKKYTNYSSANITRNLTNYSSEVNKNKVNMTEQSEADDDEDEDKIEEIYRSFKSDKHFSSEQKQDDMSLGSSNISITSESYNNVQAEAITRRSHNKDSGVLRYKTANDFVKHEVTTISSNAVEEELRTTSVSPLIELDTLTGKLNNQDKSDSNNDIFLVDSKANIDWIEENFKEIKQTRDLEVQSTTSKILPATRTQKRLENISDVSNENKSYNNKKVDTSSAEEIMSKKQLDLLNSLDYVEEDMDPKDDKFSSDTFV